MEEKKENNESENYDTKTITPKCCGSCCNCFKDIDISSMDDIVTPKELVVEVKNKLKTKNPKILNIFEKIENLVSKQENDGISLVSRLSNKIMELQEILKREEKNNLRNKEQYRVYVLKDIVNCFDSFLLVEKSCNLEENSKENLSREDFISNIQKGIKLTISQFKSNILDKNNVEIIQPKKGDDFIPNLHESFFIEETDSLPEGKIISSISKGYKINDIILKPSLVKVSKKPKNQSNSDDIKR